MAKYLGRNWTRTELLSYVSDPQQVASATPFMLVDGKAEGVKGIRVDTGSGLSFTVLPGRGMDIAGASYKGLSLCMITATGIVSPAYYEESGSEWLRNFFAGLLTTCGITNSGPPSIDQGRSYGQHGRVSNAGAEDVAVDQDWEGDEFVIRLKGRMREALPLIGENMTLTRRIETRLGSKAFSLRDVIENRGFEEQPLMLLYHMNFGYPLLGPNARIVAPARKVEPRDEAARRDRGVEEALEFPEPIQGYQEKVFFHSLAADRKGRTFVALLNSDVGDGTPLGIVMRFSLKELPAFTEWKMPGRGFYVLGLEPGTVTPLGRAALRATGAMPQLAGQASYSLSIDLEVVDSSKEMDGLRKEAAELLK
jgi:hypothetical protein